MSNCIKDLYDYELVKICSKCGIMSIKNNFHKKLSSKDGLDPRCVPCVRKYYLDNRARVKQYYLDNRDRIKEYQLKNYDKIIARKKIYPDKRYKTDNFRLICKLRSKIHQALQGKTKSSSTRKKLGIDIDTYRKWIEWQMTPEMNWSNKELDHVKAISIFDVSKDEELREVFNRRNTQPLLKEVHQQKGIKFNFLDYQLQFIKAYQFLKPNEEERFN